VIVGGGATGGWAAKHLTEKGLKVTLLDAGPYLDGRAEFEKALGKVMTGQANFLSNVDQIDRHRQATDEDQKIQGLCYAYNAATKHLFVNDVENPYEIAEGKPFTWIRCRQIGGRTNLWSRVVLRMSDTQFQSADSDLPAWPITYKDIAPHYGNVEQFIGVQGTLEGHPDVPDGQFVGQALPPQPEELMLRKAAEELWPGMPRLFRTRISMLTQPSVSLAAREALPFYSSIGSSIPAAEKTGRLKIIHNAVVHKIITDATGKKARMVEYVDANTGESREFAGKVIILCASALESTRILLNSKNENHPDGLGNSSGVLGHYLMDHVCGAWVSGTKRSHSGQGYPVEIYIPHIPSEAVRGFGSQGVCGPAFTRFVGFGEMAPRFENHVSISHSLKDKWGIPVLKIDCEYSDKERDGARIWRDNIEKLLKYSGYETEHSGDVLGTPGSSIHEMGTARMGSDPKNSVLDSHCRSWDVRNLFVTDGAAFVTSSYHNPTLTMLALTDRACAFIADHYNTEFA
jgi:choline dehydrogenase-like flavoprotein